MSSAATCYDSWVETERFFGRFAGDTDARGVKAATNLRLLNSARARWSSQLECFAVMGINMVFSPRDEPYTLWVRVEPRAEAGLQPTVSIALWSGVRRPAGASRPGIHQVIGGDICRVTTAPIVLESFLLQIGHEARADK